MVTSKSNRLELRACLKIQNWLALGLDTDGKPPQCCTTSYVSSFSAYPSGLSDPEWTIPVSDFSNTLLAFFVNRYGELPDLTDTPYNKTTFYEK